MICLGGNCVITCVANISRSIEFYVNWGEFGNKELVKFLCQFCFRIVRGKFIDFSF